MHRIVTPTEMQTIDRETIERHSIPGRELMARAGEVIFLTLTERIPDLVSKRVLILCGKGNNGGDGYVLARCMISGGITPKLIIAAEKKHIGGDALWHLEKLERTGIVVEASDAFEAPTEKYDVIVDALLGTGARGHLSEPIKSWIEWINKQRFQKNAFIVSVDIPSGLDGETGLVSDTAVTAHLTVTIGLPKRGLLFNEGKKHTGHLAVKDIGFPEILTSGGLWQFINQSDVASHLPIRRHNSNKYDFGKLIIIAGSRGMSGAALMTARAAMRSGAGVVRVAVPKSIAHVIEQGLPEAMTVHLPETEDGVISPAALSMIVDLHGWCTCAAIGPGLSKNPAIAEWMFLLLSQWNVPSVLDADALNILNGQWEVLRDVHSDMIITPHSGEFRRLFGVEKNSATAMNDELHDWQKKLNHTILLKGVPTQIAGKSHVYITQTGNLGMAKAGSGDVLTGIIAGLMAQGLESETAGFCGAYIHGLAGDIAVTDKTEYGLLAGDTVESIPKALQRITNCNS
ncbi:NAD(P)H-hydrate dehydratase [bacterium]|nr:NAD(P)H-hydrate dehydratase [bacterium]NUN46535.1 NAD(P)H-hydrate dehydratase [bacterium]